MNKNSNSDTHSCDCNTDQEKCSNPVIVVTGGKNRKEELEKSIKMFLHAHGGLRF